MMTTDLPPAADVLRTWRAADFAPRRGLGNGHVMTIFAWACRRQFATLPEPEARLIHVSGDTQVLAHCHWQAEPDQHPTLLALHGLEGSSTVHYMRGLAEKAWRRGWNVVRLNQRNCGGTEHLTPGLYHSGLTDDPRAVIRSLVQSKGLRSFGIVGYSLGGNLTVKLAGELASSPDLPVSAAVAVCPTIDLARCVDAIERRRNAIYQFNFVRNLKARMRRKAVNWPDAFDLSGLDRIRTIREFDDRYTAPHHGFGDAANYYHRASALRVADRIQIPTLILAAEDDPFVPIDQFADPAVRDNRFVQVRLSRHGGHCAFVGSSTSDRDGFWAETEALDFLSAFTPLSAGASAIPR
ncbi:MAG: alpha/beta fold hydrolase [Vicinamibacterales bacterium]